MKIAIIVCVGVAIFVLLHAVPFYKKLQIAKELVRNAEPFMKLSDDTRVSMLVLGDSTAVGVGARSPKETVPGLLTEHINATHVENYAVSGEMVRHLSAQRENARLENYSHILIQIGGNDIIRFHDVTEEKTRLAEFLSMLPEHKHLIVISAGNVGATKFFPWFINPFYTRLNLKYHDAFREVVGNAGGTYVNMYEAPERDPYVQEPKKHFAADGLHPSSDGYRVWFEKIVRTAGL